MKTVYLTIDGKEISLNVLLFSETANLFTCAVNTEEFEKSEKLAALLETSKIIFPINQKKDVFIKSEDEEKLTTYKVSFKLTDVISGDELTMLIFTKLVVS